VVEVARCAPATESLHEVDLELLAVPNQHALPREATTKVVSQVCASRCLPCAGYLKLLDQEDEVGQEGGEPLELGLGQPLRLVDMLICAERADKW
jgi:hypothetical protein